MARLARVPRYPLGVVAVTFAPLSAADASQRARALEFDFIDPPVDTDPESLALPVGCPASDPDPVAGWAYSPAPRDGPGAWEKAVTQFRASPGCLLEPWAGACVNSLEKVRAMAEDVPGLRFLIDTGHVAAWAGDPVELLEYADHVQLRQGKPGHGQLHVDDPTGTVDFAAVVRRLDEIGYEGKLAVEYFSLPQLGWPLDDPVGWADDLARRIRPLLA
jgi:sugar phosphate isomerase/epimerase